MADNGSTWLTGTDVIGAGLKTPPARSVGFPGFRSTSGVQTALTVVVFAICSALVFTNVATDWLWELVRVLSVSIALVFAFRFPLKRLKPAFVIWWVVLAAESIFFRESTGDNAVRAALNETFPIAAYGEGLAWVLCFGGALICLARVPHVTKVFFTGSYKWVTLFALLCLASCAYSPKPAFSLVWSFKLLLVVTLLVACSMAIEDFQDLLSFLRFTFVAYAIVVFEPVIISMFRGELFDEEGRMSTIVNPDALSADAAALFVLALTLFSRVKNEGLRKSAAVFGIAGFMVMILAGGKAGILSGLVAGGLFFLWRRGFGSTVAFAAGACLLSLMLASFTPLGDYLMKYESTGSTSTLSGRTILWSAVMPAILERPIVGHGYVSSTFIVFLINNVQWAAPQLHNGFMEAAYNTGILGLFLIITINVVIPVNLYRVLKRIPATDPMYRIAAGCLALYVVLLINGFFNASFGGRARPPFVLLLALVLVSDKLKAMASHRISKAAVAAH
jgi:O-antigen ligase